MMQASRHRINRKPSQAFSWGAHRSGATMSEHDDTLLDEDLGDEEYDLGNDEEEALLADDYEIERQNSYKGEEETDDVLDLGVTDALDDLDGEDENIEFSRTKTDKNNDNDFYEDGERSDARSNYYDQDERNEQQRHYEDRIGSDSASSNIGKGDLREKLQKNIQKSYVGNGQGLEDDDCEEAKERRNRFQNERTIISPKMNSNIPDTLENVVTSESSRPSFRSWGRGRASRGAVRGGRFNAQNVGNFNPRFSGVRNPPAFDNQPPLCRPPLLEPRPPFFVGVPNNIQNQPILCQQGNPQVQPFQHYSPNGPLQGPGHFVDNRGPFGANQFQGGPRQVLGPRSDFGPRPPMVQGSMPHHVQGQGQAPIPNQHGQGPPYSCPPSNQSAYNHRPPGPFQNPSSAPLQDNPPPPRFVQGNPGPLLQGNPPGGLLGNPNALPPSGGPGGILQGNQNVPLQGFPRQPSGPPIPHPNVPMGNQPPYERPPFQEPPFEGRPPFDSRPNYPDQAPPSQFSNNAPGPQPPSNMPNVPLPPGHKILINPHFRGAVQPTNDARLAWDSTQQSSSGSGSSQFPQSLQSFQNQANYNQGHGRAEQGSAPYQQNFQQSKSDDPYMYFSDVWQENKPPKPQGASPTKQYTERDSSYSRDSAYDSGVKYKSDNPWDPKDNYHEEHRGGHQSYRERELPPKPRSDYPAKARLVPSGSYRDDFYDQSHAQRAPGGRPLNMPPRGPPRLPPKRPMEPLERPLRDLSPKRIKPSNRNLQEVRTVETLHEPTVEKKDEDPEMREYRRKMEEQKRLREQILREKENRRKQAAMEKQCEEGKNEASSESGLDSKPVSVLMGVVKEAVTNKSHPGVGRGRARPVSGQTTETVERGPGVRIVRTIQSVPTSETDSLRGKDMSAIENSGQAIQPQNNTRRVVIQKPLANTQKIATTLQKTVSNLQKVALPQRMLTTVGQNQAGTLKKIITTQRIVTQKPAQEILTKTVSNVQEVGSIQKIVVNTQNNQRVLLQKADGQAKKLRDVKINTVKLENLAAGTSEAKIRSMCQGIGTIESIQMGERCATIVFKTHSAAMVFHKKYQHKMVDLSLIRVRLVPQPGGAKIPGNLVKVT